MVFRLRLYIRMQSRKRKTNSPLLAKLFEGSPRFRVAGLRESNRLFEMATGSRCLPVLLQRQAEDQVGLGEVGLAGDGAMGMVGSGAELLAQLGRVAALPPALGRPFVQQTSQLVIGLDIVVGQT